MSRNPRRLSIVGDRIDDHRETLRQAFADRQIDEREEVMIFGQVLALSGAVSCLDSRDQAAEALMENGLTGYVKRRIREVEEAERRIGWTLLRGGLPDANEAA